MIIDSSNFYKNLFFFKKKLTKINFFFFFKINFFFKIIFSKIYFSFKKIQICKQFFKKKIFLKIYIFLQKFKPITSILRHKKLIHVKKVSFFEKKKNGINGICLLKRTFFFQKKFFCTYLTHLGSIFNKKSFFGAIYNLISFNFTINPLKIFNLGSEIFVYFCNINMIIYNCNKIAMSNGTFITLLKKNFFKSYFLVLLPSCQQKKIFFNIKTLIGRNDGIF